MNCIPLPDDLIRRVYGYILPISDYIEFMKAFKEYKKKDMKVIASQIATCQKNSTDLAVINDGLDNYSEFIHSALMMNANLLKIREFIMKNPLFRKYAQGRVREGVASTITEQENHMLQIEKTIHKQRSKIKFIRIYGNTYTNTLLCHDLVHLLRLRETSLNAIIYQCRINKIPVINEPYAVMQRRAAGWINENEYRNHLVRKLMSI